MQKQSILVDLAANVQDIEPPFGERLSAIYKRSFAYVTMKHRLPVILRHLIDLLTENEEKIIQTCGKNSSEELKRIIDAIDKLRDELMINKPFVPLAVLPNRINDDVEIWNDYLKGRTKIEGKVPTWLNTIWIYSESYMYRRLEQEFARSKYLYRYDQFTELKQRSFAGSTASILAVSQYITNVLKKIKYTAAEKKHEFVKLLKLNLWANRCDLSISLGDDNNQVGNPIDLLETLEKDILANDTDLIWDLLDEKRRLKGPLVIDIVLDNAGYELFTDFCLAAFLIAHGLADKLRFHVKRMPWYVSDATANDIHWTIEEMQSSHDPQLSAFGAICANYLSKKCWTIEEDTFWTTPYVYSRMKERDPLLYAKLSEAALIIFKGDLNYRKLIGDINWEYTTNFVEALQGFAPTNIITLRTLKADICVGLPAGKAEELSEMSEDWMLTGEYGLLQSNVSLDHA